MNEAVEKQRKALGKGLYALLPGRGSSQGAAAAVAVHHQKAGVFFLQVQQHRDQGDVFDHIGKIGCKFLYKLLVY